MGDGGNVVNDVISFTLSYLQWHVRGLSLCFLAFFKS